jgi:hypothetical protein
MLIAVQEVVSIPTCSGGIEMKFSLTANPLQLTMEHTGINIPICSPSI